MRVHHTDKAILSSQGGGEPQSGNPLRFWLALGIVLLANVAVVCHYREPLQKMVDSAGGSERLLAPTPYERRQQTQNAAAPAPAEKSIGAPTPRQSTAAPAGPAAGAAQPVLKAEPAPAPPVPVTTRLLEGRIRRDQTLAAAFSKAGASAQHVHEVVSALKGVFEFRYSKPGDTFALELGEGDRIEGFEYMVSPEEIYLVKREGEALAGSRKIVQLDRRVEIFDGVIESSLYNALTNAGEGEGLAAEIADIFAWSINFYTDPRKGDRFRIIVEKLYLDGELRRYGRILAARYDHIEGGGQEAFFYRDPKGREGYYDREGRSLRKAFLKTPMRFTNITSRFGVRFHPVLKKRKKHNGVDYGAPTGTPIWTVADGKVTWAGWKGANGKLISIRHPNGYETHYAHLSRIDKKVKVGAQVSQKQVIGYVGTTGRSTGPHLHFAMKRHGRFVNPGRQKFPSGKPVPERHKAHYLGSIEAEIGRLSQPWADSVATVEGPEADGAGGDAPPVEAGSQAPE